MKKIEAFMAGRTILNGAVFGLIFGLIALAVIAVLGVLRTHWWISVAFALANGVAFGGLLESMYRKSMPNLDVAQRQRVLHALKEERLPSDPSLYQPTRALVSQSLRFSSGNSSWMQNKWIFRVSLAFLTSQIVINVVNQDLHRVFFWSGLLVLSLAIRPLNRRMDSKNQGRLRSAIARVDEAEAKRTESSALD